MSLADIKPPLDAFHQNLRALHERTLPALHGCLLAYDAQCSLLFSDRVTAEMEGCIADFAAVARAMLSPILEAHLAAEVFPSLRRGVVLLAIHIRVRTAFAERTPAAIARTLRTFHGVVDMVAALLEMAQQALRNIQDLEARAAPPPAQRMRLFLPAA